jgi:chromosome segregation ATPase
MDNNLLYIIAAFIVGVIIGLIIRSATARGRFDELESRVRTLQTSADSAKRELAGAQSELTVRDSHINTLNSNIGILEEKMRRAELTANEATALVSSAHAEAQQAGLDIPALKAELSQRDVDLADLQGQLHQRDIDLGALRDEHGAQTQLLEKAQADLAEMRAQLDEVHSHKGDLETQLSDAQDEAERLAGLRDEIDAVKSDLDSAKVAAGARLSAIESQPRLTASMADIPEDADPQLFELRDHLVRMTFAGALIAKKLDEKSRELNALKAGLPVETTRAPLATAGLVGAGYVAGKATAPEAADDVSVAEEAVAAAAPESPTPLDTSEADLSAELQTKLAEIDTLKQEKAGLQEDLQTTISGKAELVDQLQKTEDELNALKARIRAARARVQDLLSRVPAGAVAAARDAMNGSTGA